MRVNELRPVAADLAALFRARRVAVFCGAGISFNSGLPLVGQIVECILQELGATPTEQQALLNAAMPFELFMQTLQEQSNIDALFEMFDGGEPNANHFLLARLMRAGLLKAVCTTNFDTLLERALAACGMDAGRDYELYATNEELESIDWDVGLPKLVKVHGSVTDRPGMAITLRQVAGRVLTVGRGHVVDRLFRKADHDTTLVLGYSCSDQFDISPRIASYPRSAITVLLVEHERVLRAEEPIASRVERNPFRRFNGKRLFLNTNDLVRDLWSSLLEEPSLDATSKMDDAWKERVRNWASRDLASEARRSAVISSLSFAAGRPQLGLVRLQGERPRGQNAAEQLVALINKGAGLNAAGRHDEGIKFLGQAMGLAQALDHRMALRQVLANLGMAYAAKGHDSMALRISQEGERLALADGDSRMVGACRDTISTCYANLGDIAEALRYAKLALKEFVDLGEFRYAAVVTGNLGLLEEKRGALKEALVLHERAFAMTETIGDAVAGQGHLTNIVRLARSLNKPKTLDRYEAKAAAAVTSGDSDHDRAIATANYANHLSTSGKPLEALPLYEHALELLRQCGDDYGIALHSSNRAITLSKLKRHVEAACDFERSAKVYGAIGMTERQADALIGRARAFQELDQPEEILVALEAAAGLMRNGNYSGAHQLSDIEAVIQSVRRHLDS